MWFFCFSYKSYVTRIITLGTLVAIYLSTSDEMIPILLSHNVPIIEIVKLVGLKVVIGIIFGIIIDFFYRKRTEAIFIFVMKVTAIAKNRY